MDFTLLLSYEFAYFPLRSVFDLSFNNKNNYNYNNTWQLAKYPEFGYISSSKNIQKISIIRLNI